MDNQLVRSRLKKVGAILIAIGILDIGICAYVVSRNESYSSSLLFALIAGIFVYRANPRAVRVVSWLSVLAATTLTAFSVFGLIVQPWGLTVAYFRLHPWSLIWTDLWGLLSIAVLLWVSTELSRKEMVAYSHKDNKNPTPYRYLVVAGLVFALGGVWSMHVMRSGAGGQYVLSVAKQQFGEEFDYHITSMRHYVGRTLTTSSSAPSIDQTHEAIDARVVLWNDEEIKQVPIHWEASR